MKSAAKRHPSLVDQVTEGLRNQIRSEEFLPGEMLPSVQSLSDKWGVSRTVVREGLARLSADGLVNSRQGLGVFVVETLPIERLDLLGGSDPSDLESILEFRMGLETEAAGLAASRRLNDDLRHMQNALDAMQEALELNDIDRGIYADLDFHRAICLAVGNTYYDRLFSFLHQSFFKNISVSRRNSAGLRGRGKEAQSEHLAIMDAIAKGDAPRARSAMRRHLVKTGQRLNRAMAVSSQR